MGTIADKLELLRRTKERQRAYLEQKYPLLDFDTIPFRAYLDLFQGRSYVPGFVGGWKAYGRSNDEDASTRDILPDYSGNGRDIKLYNFAFAGMCGYGGYPISLLRSGGNNITATKKATVATYTLTADSTSIAIWVPKSDYLRTSAKVRVNISAEIVSGAKIVIYNDDWTIAYSQDIAINTIAAIEKIPDEYIDDSEAYKGYIYFVLTPVTGNTFPNGTSFSIEIFPNYPGALVSDGVDDYGQCIKDFALPDDYTVVAIRKITNGNGTGFASKGGTSGAFIFDATSDKVGTNAWSYGKSTYISPMPALFSYQTKTSYNGKTITPGTAEDTEADPFYIFTHVKVKYSQSAFYDLRIYDHSLTAEELQTVKDEMMSDYENATGGGITDITYVADWDGKGRSNDEEEPMRSQWVDKATGKVINLSNYSFSQMSGWNGYAHDWTKWGSAMQAQGGTIIKEKNKVTVTNFGNQPNWTIIFKRNLSYTGSFKVRISGLKKDGSLVFTGGTGHVLFWVEDNGVVTVPDISEYNQLDITAYGYAANESANLVIEQLPLYPGALVSDGVDDFGKTEEVINDKIGSVVMQARVITPQMGRYFFNADSEELNGRVYCWQSSERGDIAAGLPSTVVSLPFMTFSREPKLVNGVFNIGYNIVINSAIYRLMLIREQLDDAQLEFLEWKVEKEYRDWCKENGYDYAITEMWNN